MKMVLLYYYFLFKAHTDMLGDLMKGMQLGLLIACGGSEQVPLPHNIFDIAVVVEETIVLHNLKDIAQSFAMLLGVIYAVNLEYPDAMKYSFSQSRASLWIQYNIEIAT